MLEKVLNINPGSDYKKSTGNPKYYKKVSSYNFSFSSANDSLYISPATSLLARLGWKIKKLSSDNEKIHIFFELDGFDFEAGIDLNELNHNPKIEYRAKKSLDRYSTEIMVTVSLSAPINTAAQGIKSDIKLSGLHKFFSQFESARYKKPSIINETGTIELLMYDLRREMNSEFNLINSCFVNFLEKYISIKPAFQQNTGDEGIVIKSIHIQ